MSAHGMESVRYPRAEATHEQVVADRELFYKTLDRLHSSLGIKAKVPKIGGVEVDLHLMYKEVTTLGGVDLVIARKQFVLVCEPFNFPPSFTNRSFVMKKLYLTALYHYEQLYYHRRQGRLADSAAEAQPGGPSFDRLAPGTPKRKADPCGPEPVAIIPIHTTPGSPAVPLDCGAGTRFAGTIDSNADGGYSITLDLPGQRLQAILYHPGSPHPKPLSMQQLERVRHGNDSFAAQQQLAKSPRVSPRVSPRGDLPPKPARLAQHFFAATVNKEQVLKLNADPVTGAAAPADQLPRFIAALWQQMSDEQRQPFVDMAAKDTQRFKMEYWEYEQRLRGSGAAGASPAMVAARLPSSPAGCSRGEASYQLPYELAASPMQAPLCAPQYWQHQHSQPSHLRRSSTLPHLPHPHPRTLLDGDIGDESPGLAPSMHAMQSLHPDSAGLPYIYSGTSAYGVSGISPMRTATSHQPLPRAIAPEPQYLSSLALEDTHDTLEMAMDMLGDNDNSALIDFFGCSTHIQVTHNTMAAIKSEAKDLREEPGKGQTTAAGGKAAGTAPCHTRPPAAAPGSDAGSCPAVAGRLCHIKQEVSADDSTQEAISEQRGSDSALDMEQTRAMFR